MVLKRPKVKSRKVKICQDVKSVNLIRDIGVDPRLWFRNGSKAYQCCYVAWKKNAARTIVYEAIDILIKKADGDKEKALNFLIRQLIKYVPAIEVRPRRVGGSVYQIPTEVNPHRARALSYALAY